MYDILRDQKFKSPFLITRLGKCLLLCTCETLFFQLKIPCVPRVLLRIKIDIKYTITDFIPIVFKTHGAKPRILGYFFRVETS